MVQPNAPQEMSLSQSLVDGEWLDSEIEKGELSNRNDLTATEEQHFDDDLVDPFKKRVNPNFQATQIPSYDWTAPEFEPQNSREVSLSRERLNSPETQTFSKNTSHRNSNIGQYMEI